MKLYKKAESFYQGFVSESESPDILILHQVNPILLRRIYFFKAFSAMAITKNPTPVIIGGIITLGA